MLDVKDITEKLNKDIIKKIMSENGGTLFQEKEKELWYDTICHGGDSHKLCYYDETKTFHCYTNCGQMSVFQLIMKIKNYSFVESLNYVKGFFISDYTKGFFHKKKINDIREETRKENSDDTRKRQEKKLKGFNCFYEEEILNYFEDIYYSGWFEEGISVESMEKFGLKWYEKEKHIIIPHRDINGNLIGIRRRSLKPEDKNNKYMPEIIGKIAYGHSLGMNLYGLYENKEAIKKSHTAIIVEGEKSVLLSDSFFGDKSCAVATCGFNLSQHQINLLLDECQVRTIYLGFDKDFDVMDYDLKYDKTDILFSRTETYINRLNRIAYRLKDRDVKIIIDRDNLLLLKDSPFDRGKDVYLQLRKNAIQTKINLKDIRSNLKNRQGNDEDYDFSI